MKMFRIFICAFVGHLLCASNVLAHRPYSRPAGTFIRPDGVTISATKNYSDGIIFRDPVVVSFALPDGTVLAETENIQDRVIVRTTPRGFVLYRFPSDWLPTATNVHLFDGYSLTNITSPHYKKLSVLVHTQERWQAYAVTLGFAGIGLAVICRLRSLPPRGWWRVLKALGYVTLTLVGLFLSLMFFGSGGSPFIFLLLASVCAALLFGVWLLLPTSLKSWVAHSIVKV